MTLFSCYGEPQCCFALYWQYPRSQTIWCDFTCGLPGRPTTSVMLISRSKVHLEVSGASVLSNPADAWFVLFPPPVRCLGTDRPDAPAPGVGVRTCIQGSNVDPSALSRRALHFFQTTLSQETPTRSCCERLFLVFGWRM